MNRATSPEARGKAIYLTGKAADGTTMQASMVASGATVPASILKCVNCHGRDGRGRAEGGVYPSDIRWSELSKPYEVKTRSGRTHPGYTEALDIRGLGIGVDAGGNPLHATMPRYQLTHQQASDVIAYLKLLKHEPEPGITDSAVKIGVLLPPSAAFEGIRRAIGETLSAFFDEINARGGIYGRRLVLSSMVYPDAPSA